MPDRLPDDDLSPDLLSPRPDRDPGRSRRSYDRGRRRRGRLLLAGALICALGLLAAGWFASREDPLLLGPQAGAGVASTARATSVPPACADALALADLLAQHVGHLAPAINDHVDVMERLDLGLEGKPGGITGHEAYVRGQAQMRVFEADGPDAEVQVKRYLRVRRGCPAR